MLTPRLQGQFSLTTLTILVFLFSLFLTQNTLAAEQLPPEITKVETFREGDMVFFRLFYTDPNNDAEGFGFRGANGSGWAEETHPFSSPSYGRWSPGIIEYPFNHRCGTESEFESDVEAWIYDSTGLRGASVTVHLACSAPEEGAWLDTKQEIVGLDILQSNSIPLENLTVSTLLSEYVLATGDTTTSVTVANVNKGQITFVSNTDGNPFVVAYIPASDIQNGTTSITLDSIADGFIMLNPLMLGFRDSNRLAILAYAKNTPLYQALKNEINIALQTDPYNLLEESIFPNIYGNAIILIIDAINNIEGEALSKAVVENAMIGQSDVPYLNDLGSGKIEVVNPTMVFYGFTINNQSEQLIHGKDEGWSLQMAWPPIQATDPIKDPLILSDGYSDIKFSKLGLKDSASKMATAANFLRSSCNILDCFFWCPIKNRTIAAYVEEGSPQPSLHTLALAGNDIVGDVPEKIPENTIKILLDPKVWPIITKALYKNASDKKAAVSFLKNSKAFLKAAKTAVKYISTAINAANVYIPFNWDMNTKPSHFSYCVTLSGGVLSETCKYIPPTAVITLITPSDQIYAGKVVQFDASLSSDPVYSTDSLLMKWDFDNDGAYDTDWSASNLASWVYNNDGKYSIILQVKNQDELIGQSTHTVIVNTLTNGIPVITKVNFPQSIPANGSHIPGTVEFKDSNAGVNWADFFILKDTCGGCLTPFAFDPQVSHFTEGKFGFYMWCTEGGFSWTTRLTLKDAENHVSRPYDFSIECKRVSAMAKPMTRELSAESAGSGGP
jgi:hypothetical protein